MGQFHLHLWLSKVSAFSRWRLPRELTVQFLDHLVWSSYGVSHVTPYQLMHNANIKRVSLTLGNMICALTPNLKHRWAQMFSSLLQFSYNSWDFSILVDVWYYSHIACWHDVWYSSMYWDSLYECHNASASLPLLNKISPRVLPLVGSVGEWKYRDEISCQWIRLWHRCITVLAHLLKKNLYVKATLCF